MPETFQRKTAPLIKGATFGQSHTRVHHGRETVAHVGKIFLEVLHDLTAAVERCEHIDETKHLDLEMFVAHGERHHALIETGLAEKRFGMAIDELKNALAAPLGFNLE